MRIDVRVECSPTEFRRLQGLPDLTPVYDIIVLGLELWLADLVLAGDRLRRSDESIGTPSDDDERTA